MTFAKNFKGVLQLVHGTMDDNVHMQNSIQLLSALEDNGKEVEFMLYPGGRHGWGGAKGKHFLDLKNKFIYKTDPEIWDHSYFKLDSCWLFISYDFFLRGRNLLQ
jgi:dienelactone hydrolase